MEPTQAAQTEREYVAQHFGFDPRLVDDIAEESHTHLTNILGILKVQIEKKYSGKFEQEALDMGFKKIEAKYAAGFDDIFQKLGPYIYANVFKVPRHVLLKEDSPWDDLKPHVAKTKLAEASAAMERKRELYRNLLYRRARLRGELEARRLVQQEFTTTQIGVKEAASLKETEDLVDIILYKRKQLSQNLERLTGLKRKSNQETSWCRNSKRARLSADLENYQPAA